MSRYSIKVSVVLTEMNCGECGGTYAINERYREQKYQEGGGWNCPYCRCTWGYYSNGGNSDLKKQLAKEKKRRKWAEENASNAEKIADSAKRRLSAQKGVTTRLKNRVKAGVCPCCNRTFKQLAAHMKNKHPDYNKEKKHG